MILSRWIPVGLILALTACQTAPKARAAKLAALPDASQSLAIKTAVTSAMGRTDLDMDPGRLVDTPILIVRPVAVPGITDRVPGSPRRFTLMTLENSCFLLEAGGGMRIDLPEMACV